MNTIAFCSELFSDHAVELTEIPIAVTGTWIKDNRRFTISEEDLADIVKNFEKRGTGEIVVDFEHASERPEVAHGGPVPAAGWIKSLDVREKDDGDGYMLWADVDFNADAQRLIREKKYKYFSPAIDWGAADKKTGKSKGATVTSGALTNHPFLEELPAIQLSEKAGKVVDRMLLPVVDKKNKLTDISLDQRRSAVNDAIQSEYGGKVSSPLGCSPSSCLWVKEMFENYAIIEQDGKLWKFSYTMDSKGNVELGEPEQVTVEYVAAAELSERHGTTFADSGAVTKAEGDGDHPSSHYLVVEDPKKPSTWHLRVKDANGKNDHRLMGGAWAALHEGYRGNKYEGPKKQEAISKLEGIYESEGLDTPDQQKASERFAALPSGQKRAEVGREIARHSHEVFGNFPWVETMADDHVVVKHDGQLYRIDYAIGPDGKVVVAAPQKKFKPKVRQASEVTKKEERAMSDNGMQRREGPVNRDISDGEEREYHRNGLRPDRGGATKPSAAPRRSTSHPTMTRRRNWPTKKTVGKTRQALRTA